MGQFIVLFWITLSVVHAEDCPAQLNIVRGAVIRLAIVHNDGFGDMLNAIDLARQLKARWPQSEFPLVIDVSAAYQSLKTLFPNFKSETQSNFVYGVEIVDGTSPRGQEIYRTIDSQILRIPAATRGTSLFWGTGKHNLYIEEPGAQRRTMAYADELEPGVVQIKEGSSHLRLNPGFGAKEFGVSIPNIDKLGSRSRDELLDVLAKDKGITLNPGLVQSEWGVSYNHADLKIDAKSYYRALLQMLRDSPQKHSVVIFDFSDSEQNLGQKSPLARWDRVRARFDGVRVHQARKPNWRDKHWAGNLLTIVQAGPVAHNVFLGFLREADVPVAITGTQSLFEAIALGKVFSYEYVPWKMALIYGMAEVAQRNFNAKEAEYLIDWLCGQGDTLKSPEDIHSVLDAYEHSNIDKPEFEGPRHHRALLELWRSSERRSLVERFIAKLRERDQFLDTILKNLANTVSQPGTPTP